MAAEDGAPEPRSASLEKPGIEAIVYNVINMCRDVLSELGEETLTKKTVKNIKAKIEYIQAAIDAVVDQSKQATAYETIQESLESITTSRKAMY